MKMTAKEKLCWMVHKIADLLEITPEGHPVKIRGRQHVEGTAILNKLMCDYEVINLLEIPKMIPSWVEPPHYLVEVYDTFPAFHAKLKKTPTYKSMLKKLELWMLATSTSSEQPEPEKEQPLPQEGDVVYSLSFNGQYLLINNAFILARTDFDSENELVISFLIGNPNKRFAREQIQKELSTREGREVLIKKPFHKIAENLGFKGDFLKAFLDVSKTTICLKNPVTRKDLDSVGIKYLKIAK